MRTDDTIAAVSTPEGRGGIGIIRISGPDAARIAARVFRPASGKPMDKVPGRTAVLGHVVDERGALVDEAVAIRFAAPRSYTREDMVELHGHGGTASMRRTLGLVLDAGARPAEPGEFTLRAYLNGRIDLAQAEAVMDVVEAGTGRALAAAAEQLGGSLGRRIAGCEENVVEILSRIEASIEYPEYEETAITRDAILLLARGAEETLAALEAGFQTGRLLREGITVVIAGRPNAGKSSLMNELSGHERSIVTDVPGTTRDTVDERVDIDGIPARLVDTAGLREDGDAIENLGMARARRAIETADVVVYLIDANAGILPGDLETVRAVASRPHVVAINKSDLVSAEALEALRRAAAEAAGEAHVLSLKTGEGADALRKVIAREAGAGEAGSNAGSSSDLMTNARHHALVREALGCIRSAREAVENGVPPDVAAVDLRVALDALGKITGRTAGEEVLEAVFSRFCLGK